MSTDRYRGTSERPAVSLVLAMSVDGKIATTARDPVNFTSRRDRARLHALRDGADAILVGAGTIRAEDPPLLPTEERARARVDRNRNAYPLRAVVSASLDLPAHGRALEARDDAPVVVYTATNADDGRRAELVGAGIEVENSGEQRVDLRRALESLRTRRGVSSLVCEGGGILGFELFEADLVDDLYLTICPVVIGGGKAPTVADGRGFRKDALKRLELVESSVEEGEVFLHYRVRRPV